MREDGGTRPRTDGGTRSRTDGGARRAGASAVPRDSGTVRRRFAMLGRALRGAVPRAVRVRLPAVVGAGILAVLLWRLGTGAFLVGLRRIDGPALLAAVGLGVLTTVCSAWRWCLVARGLGIRLPLGTAVADYYRALFLNAALPGGVVGDVHRAVRHGRTSGDMGRGVRAVVLERAAGQVVLMAVGVALLLAEPTPALAVAHHAVQHVLHGVVEPLTTRAWRAEPGPAPGTVALAVVCGAAVCGLFVAAVVAIRTAGRGPRGTRARKDAASRPGAGAAASRPGAGAAPGLLGARHGRLRTAAFRARTASRHPARNVRHGDADGDRVRRGLGSSPSRRPPTARTGSARTGSARTGPAQTALGPTASARTASARTALVEARRALLARGRWPGVVAASVVVLAGHLGTFLLAARVAGSTAPFAELAPLMVLALLAMALPLNVGGWGPREGVTAWTFGAAGLGAAHGLTVAVVYGVLTFAASLPGAAVLAARWLGGGRSGVPRAARTELPQVRARRTDLPQVRSARADIPRVPSPRADLPEVEFEQCVLAERRAPHRRTQRVPHHGRTGEPESGDAVA